MDNGFKGVRFDIIENKHTVRQFSAGMEGPFGLLTEKPHKALIVNA